MLSQWLGWKFSIDDHRSGGGSGSGCCCKVIFLLLYTPTPILFLARTCRTALGHYTPPRHYHHRGREPWIMIAWALAGGRTGKAVWLVPDKCVWFTATGRLVFQKWLYYTGPREEIDRERTRGEKKTRARQQSFGGVLLVAVALGGVGGGRSNGKNQICWQAERIYRWAPQSDETDSVTVGPKA